MLKKIKSIRNMAVYNDFDWDREVRDKKGNNIMSFKSMNIIYGRNYSGKTTLSRIIRSLENGELSDKYKSPEFKIEFEDGITAVTQDTRLSHPFQIRVFNEDFVRDNLKFISNPDAGVNSFAILGDDNVRIEEKIEALEKETYGDDGVSGLKKEWFDRNAAVSEEEREKITLSYALAERLRRKANDEIKTNPFFGDARYNISKINDDILTVSSEGFKPLVAQDESKLTALIKEEKRDEIPPLPNTNFKLTEIISSALEVLNKEITVSEPIAELINNSLLQQWVKNGRALHQDKREYCAFCGGVIPTDLWNKLDLHFNLESETVANEVLELINLIKREVDERHNSQFLSSRGFYSNFKDDAELIAEKYHGAVKVYINELIKINKALALKQKNIFSTVALPSIKNNTQYLKDTLNEYDLLRERSNQLTASLSREQAKAKEALRLNEVYKFKNIINYEKENVKISAKERLIVKLKLDLDQVSQKIKINENEIVKLKEEVQDENKGADKVNYYMNSYFGHDSLCLKPIKNEEGVRFDVMRGDVKAHHLSEGECSLLSFCYFMAKMDDLVTRDKKPIIWVDDPICSLDSNHIFFVFSLISNEIIKKEKFSQIFISTHNLDFLKFLKKMPGASDNKKSNYFIVERKGKISALREMPKYLKSFVTEFNYLFEQIYKCATENIGGDGSQDCYYNFGNNARKFLESFLYYKYPNAVEKDDKISRFFNDEEVGATFLNRVLNEYSHLDGVLERGSTPIDIPEMQITAKYILRKIYENDQAQYSALLQSIGVEQV